MKRFVCMWTVVYWLIKIYDTASPLKWKYENSWHRGILGSKLLTQVAKILAWIIY